MKFHDLFIPTSRNNFKAVLLRTESIALLTLFMFAFDAVVGILPTTITSAQLDMNSLAYLHNKERIQVGLNTLELNSSLITSATNKANAMLESDCWDHYCPPGVSPWTFFDQVGYKYVHAGENLGEGFSDNSSLMRAWMNSPTHKANVLKPEYLEVGIGFATGTFQEREDNTISVVHFGARAQMTPAPTQTPAPTPFPTPTNTPVVTSTPVPTQVSTPVLTPNITVTPTPVPATPIPTLVVIQNEERNPEDLLENLTINYPEANKTYTDPVREISGIAEPGIDEVALYINNNLITRTIPEDGSYTFKSDTDTTLELYDGTYDVKVEGIDSTSSSVTNSANVTFSIEIKDNPISEGDIKVEELIQEYDDTKVIISYLPMDIKVQSARLYIDEEEIVGKLDGEHFKFETTKTEIDSSKEIQLEITDSNGEVKGLDVTKQLLQNQISKIMLHADFPSDGTETYDSFLTLPGSDYFKVDFSFLSLKGKVNILVLAFLLILFIVDFVVINKLRHIKNIRDSHNHHLTVGFIVILVIITLLSTGVGSVAVGLSI